MSISHYTTAIQYQEVWYPTNLVVVVLAVPVSYNQLYNSRPISTSGMAGLSTDNKRYHKDATWAVCIFLCYIFIYHVDLLPAVIK